MVVVVVVAKSCEVYDGDLIKGMKENKTQTFKRTDRLFIYTFPL